MFVTFKGQLINMDKIVHISFINGIANSNEYTFGEYRDRMALTLDNNIRKEILCNEEEYKDFTEAL